MSDDVKIDGEALTLLFTSPEGATAKWLKRTGLKVLASAKRQCPVDTGRLRSSLVEEMHRDDQGLYELIGTDVEYAPDVEFGTLKQQAQPFLRPALNEAVK